MTECSLIEENGRAHFLTKRFDRINGEKFAVLLRLIFCMSATTMGKADKMDFRENDENWRRGVLGLPPEDEGGFGGIDGIALGLEIIQSGNKRSGKSKDKTARQIVYIFPLYK